MTDTFVRDPRHPCWGFPGFPAFVTEFRDDQWQAFLDITAAYNRGAKVVLLDAPVGTGKTVVSEMVRRWKAKRSAYLCSDKSLQDQFMRDFPYAALLKGRANYPTVDNPSLLTAPFPGRVDCGDCDKGMEMLPACGACPPDLIPETEQLHCSECHPVRDCPYDLAKTKAIQTPLICVNTSYFLAEGNSAGKVCGHRAFVTVDECDLLEKEMMGYVEVTISTTRRQRYKIEFPKRKTAKAGEEYWWPVWFEETIGRLRVERSKYGHHPTRREDRREQTFLDRLIGNLSMVQATIDEENGLTGWVYDGYESGNIVFKPVKVDAFGPDSLWNHADEWLLMSGTIIDPVEMMESLGIPDEKPWHIVTVPMSFPKKNRPVFVIPVAEMTRKNKDVAWPLVLAKTQEIAALHPTDRILVHAVSYDLARYLTEGLPRDRVITYGASTDRAGALASYLSQPGAILVAPSMDRGVDLPGEACRVQVICKLPFPYLGDKQIQTRLYATRGGQQWYVVQCIRSFVQMTGRGVRHKDDHAVTYILDKAFQNNIWKKGKHLLPKYLVEALDWSGRLPSAPPL